jgi:DNA (cytosine-5)-methyltransferase 1
MSKIAINRPQRPTVIDLFSGVGGLSLGAARAGFEVRAAVELDPIALRTHALNFPETKHIQQDVAELTGSRLLDLAGLQLGGLDGLIGGPPCQGFSLMGHRLQNDPRNKLFFDFFRLVAETQPRFFLAENVPGILSDKTKHVLETAWGMVPRNYVLFRPVVLKASDIGAATNRTRVFLIGINADRMKSDLIGADVESISPCPTFVGHALKGLPSIRSAWSEESQGWRVVDDLPSDPFFERVTNAIPVGVGSQLAIARWGLKREVSGCLGTMHTKETIERFSQVKPGKSDPVSRAPRLEINGFCPTIRAGTAADRGSFQAVRPIHPGSPRVITPREAARLQGFPDWFQFHGTKWHSFRQIGNSVSPIVGESILKALSKKLAG